MSRFHIAPVVLVVVNTSLVEVRGETCLQGPITVLGDLKIEHKERFVGDWDRTTALNVDLGLLDAAEDISDETRFEDALRIFLDARRFKWASMSPFLLSLNVGDVSFLVFLGNVDGFQFFMHLVEQVTQKVTSILLLHIRIVHHQEWLEDVLRVDGIVGVNRISVDLAGFIKEFTNMNHLTKQSIPVKNCLNIWILRDGLQ